MGAGSYSQQSRSIRTTTDGYSTKSANEIFRNRLSPEMNPKNVKIRESRDSVEHPNTVPIILGLDVTGSMEYIPHELIKTGLPTFMGNLIELGILDPQVLFLALGDYKCDIAPLQVSQFESSDELLDKWLTSVYLEGHGGGNGGESYSLAHYLAAYHTSLDSFEKRGKKGFLFTIGDDADHNLYPKEVLKDLVNSSELASDQTAAQLIMKAKETYNVYHLSVNNNNSSINDSWRELLGENLIVVLGYLDIPNIITKIIIDHIDQCDTVSEKMSVEKLPLSEADTEEEIIIL